MGWLVLLLLLGGGSLTYCVWTGVLVIAGLFAMGTVGFWLLMAMESVMLVTCLEYEDKDWTGAWATVSLVATLAVLQFFGDIKAFTYFLAHPFNLLIGVSGYFVAGTLWSFAKWWFYTTKKREKYDVDRLKFLMQNDVVGDVMPEELKADWSRRWSLKDIKPRFMDHKALILMWMTYWPWSAFWTLLNDPIKRAFNHILLKAHKVYQMITDRVFKGVEDDFIPPSPRKRRSGGAGEAE